MENAAVVRLMCTHARAQLDCRWRWSSSDFHLPVERRQSGRFTVKSSCVTRKGSKSARFVILQQKKCNFYAHFLVQLYKSDNFNKKVGLFYQTVAILQTLILRQHVVIWDQKVVIYQSQKQINYLPFPISLKKTLRLDVKTFTCNKSNDDKNEIISCYHTLILLSSQISCK